MAKEFFELQWSRTWIFEDCMLINILYFFGKFKICPSHMNFLRSTFSYEYNESSIFKFSLQLFNDSFAHPVL